MMHDPLVMFGSIKVFDGLFIADEIAAGDLEFLSSNKVKRIINCSCNQIPNHWSSINIKYLSFDWREEYEFIQVDEDICSSIYEFIETGLSNSTSIMIHGIHNQSTSYLVVTIYLMMKFNWNFERTFNYMITKQPNFYLVPHFVSITKVVEQFVQLKNQHNLLKQKGSQLDLLMNKPSELQQNDTIKEEVLIWNTFLNTRTSQQQEEAQQNQNNMKNIGSSTLRQDELALLDNSSVT